MQLFEIVNLNSLRTEYALEEHKLIDFSVGYDGVIYLLFCDREPELLQGKFVNTESLAHFTAVFACWDWENRELLGIEVLDLGLLPFNYYMLRPLQDSFVLVGARCWNRGSTDVDKNVLLLDRSGAVKREFCFGDGIEDCVTTSDGRILTSYFDEGIFGNLGWKDPIGAPGLIVWDAQGNMLWKNGLYDISDCYAVNWGVGRNLWFYSYPEYKLVCTNFVSDMQFDLQTKECNALALSCGQDVLIYSDGWNSMTFCACRVDWKKGILGEKELRIPYLNGRRLTKARYHCSGDKLLFAVEDGQLCGYVVTSDS